MAAASASASASSSSAAAAAAAAPMPDIGEPIKRLADLTEAQAKEEGLRTLTVAGVSILTTTVFRQIIGFVYSVLTVEGVHAAMVASLQGAYTWFASAPMVITVEFLVIAYLASFLGGGFIESVLKPVIMNLTKDPATKALRGVMLDNIRRYVSFTREKVDEIIMNAFVQARGPQFIDAATAYVGARFGEVRAALASENLRAAGSAFVGTLSTVLLPPSLPGGDVRQDILDLREAIKLWVMAQAVKGTLAPARAGGSTEAESIYKTIQDLEGRIVSLIGILEAAGLSEKEIETYIEFGLPGLMGFLAERGAFRATGAMASRVASGATVLMSYIQDFAGRLLFGDLYRKPKTRSVVALMTGRQLSILERVRKMNEYLESREVEVPPPGEYRPAREGVEVVSRRSSHTGELVNLLIQRDRIAKELFTKYSGVVPPEAIDDAINELIGRPGEGAPDETVELDRLRVDIRDSLVEMIKALRRKGPMKKSGVVRVTRRPPNPSLLTKARADKKGRGSAGRNTRRKHHKKSRRRRDRREKSRRRRRTVANRRGKRANRRRRSNRRAAKRSKE